MLIHQTVQTSFLDNWTSLGVPGNSACCCPLPPWRFGFKDLQPFMLRCVQRCFNNEEILKTGKVILPAFVFGSHDLKTFRDIFSNLYQDYMCTSLSLLSSNNMGNPRSKVSTAKSAIIHKQLSYGGLSFSRFHFHWVCMGLP